MLPSVSCQCPNHSAVAACVCTSASEIPCDKGYMKKEELSRVKYCGTSDALQIHIILVSLIHP